MIRDYLRGTRSVYEGQIASLTAEAAPGAGEATAGGDGRAEPCPARGGDGGAPRVHQGRRQGQPARRLVAHRAVPGDVRGPGARDHRARRRRHRPAAPPLPPLRLARPVGGLRLSAPPCRGTSRCAAACGSSSPTSASSASRGSRSPAAPATSRSRCRQPAGVVPVRVSGGASKVMLRRPARHARLAPRSAAAPASSSSTGSGSAPSAGAPCSRPGGFADAADRYEIRFTGGASQVTVDGCLRRPRTEPLHGPTTDWAAPPPELGRRRAGLAEDVALGATATGGRRIAAGTAHRSSAIA